MAPAPAALLEDAGPAGAGGDERGPARTARGVDSREDLRAENVRMPPEVQQRRRGVEILR